MTITIRSEKGSALTHVEMDENFTDLRDHPNGLIVDPDPNNGILINDATTPASGWHDLLGYMELDPDSLVSARRKRFFSGTQLGYAFVEGEEAFAGFHLPHDYKPGTDMLIHVHWTHESAAVTGGTVTWIFECAFAKRDAVPSTLTTKNISVVQTCNTGQYYHYVSEGQLSTSGGAANLLDTDELETDGVILCRLELDSHDMTGDTPEIFAFYVDIHYQSTGLPTKNNAAPFHT